MHVYDTDFFLHFGISFWLRPVPKHSSLSFTPSFIYSISQSLSQLSAFIDLPFILLFIYSLIHVQ